MPLEWVAIRYTAQKSGSFKPRITVPAVTEACRPQAAQSPCSASAKR